MSLPNGRQLDRGDVWKCRVKFTSKYMQMWSVVFSSSIEGISLKDPDQIKCDKNDIDVPLPPEINEITWFCSLHQKVIRLPEGHHWCLCHLKWDGMWHGPAWLIWSFAFATWKSWVTESCFPFWSGAFATLIESDVTGQRHTKAYERHLLSDDLEPSMLTVTQKNCWVTRLRTPFAKRG